MSFDPSDYNDLTVTQTEIPGFFIIRMPVHGDNRGWFKENYQREKMESLGLPYFEIIQNNISFNVEKGVTRGLHAEPWEKFISIATGSVFGAWVDLREGPSYGKKLTLEINPGIGVFVPRGVANGFQTLEENVAYTYLVNAHWSADAKYAFVHAFDPDLSVAWPIPRDQAIFSDKDAAHPFFKDTQPLKPEEL